MIKILFIVDSIGMQIPSNTYWNGTLITEMNDSHIKNTIAWCHRRAKSFKECKLTEEKIGYYTFTEWKEILLAELKRRKEKQIQILRSEIQRELEKANPDIKITRLQKELLELEKEITS